MAAHDLPLPDLPDLLFAEDECVWVCPWRTPRVVPLLLLAEHPDEEQDQPDQQGEEPLGGDPHSW